MAKESIRKGGDIMGKKYRNNCEDCYDCEYLGEGDFACMKYNHPVIVKEDWGPTDYYSNCKMCEKYIPNLKGE